MQRRLFGQEGFHVVELVLVALVVGALGFVGYRVLESRSRDSEGNEKSQSQASESAVATEDDIVLKNLGIDTLDNVLIDSNALREYSSKGLKGFYVFGDKLGGKEDTRLNPNFEYSSLKPGTKVVAAIDGVVAFIKEQTDSGDKEVFIQPKDGSAWTVGYDHLANVTVQKGASVSAGDIIGEPAIQGNGSPRFEIQINRDEDGQTTHYCPVPLLDDSVESKFISELTQMLEQWEKTSNLDLYDIATQKPVGCILPTMTSQQAEGS